MHPYVRQVTAEIHIEDLKREAGRRRFGLRARSDEASALLARIDQSLGEAQATKVIGGKR